MNSKTCPCSGWCLIGIGVIHNLFGLIVGWEPLIDALRAGGIGVWDDPPLRGFIYWYLSYGFALWVLGAAVTQIEGAMIRPSLLLVTLLAFLAILGVITQPVSGLWLLFIPLVLLIRQRRRVAL